MSARATRVSTMTRPGLDQDLGTCVFEHFPVDGAVWLRHTYRSGMDFQVLGPLRASRDGVGFGIPRRQGTHASRSFGGLRRSGGAGDCPDRVAVGRQSAAERGQECAQLCAWAAQQIGARQARRSAAAADIGTGYQLAIAPSDTDAGRFCRLADLAGQALAGGRPEAAVEASRDALDLWRGAAYAGCEDTAFGQAEARRLEELRLSVVETRTEALLALGRERAVVVELERHVGDHPLRERLWELLILAYYRGGQQAQALATYERVRGVLADELGVDPGHGLRQLHGRILAQDPTLELARRRVTVPAELRDETPLVGRDAELRALREAWQRTLAGAPATVVVRGPVGAGATRLAAALALEVARDGAAVETSEGGAGEGPWLLVANRVVPRPDRAMLLCLAGPGSTVPNAATVLDLSPLSESEVRRVVSAYVSPRDIDGVTAEVLGSGPAWPGRVHEAAARLAREAAAQRLASAVGVAGEASARLIYARAEASESIVTLSERVPLARTAKPGQCPWRGLASYEIEDAPWFAGREHLVAALLARLATTRLLVIVGPSGSGKSSALRAGMLAALTRDVLPGSSTWRQVVMRPGRHPMRELARASLGRQDGDLGDVLAQLIRTEESAYRSLLVVDQMEEVWTACEDDGEREAFLGTLVELSGRPAFVDLGRVGNAG